METMSRINIEKFMIGSKSSSKSIAKGSVNPDEVLEGNAAYSIGPGDGLPEVEYQFTPLAVPNKLSMNDRMYSEVIFY